MDCVCTVFRDLFIEVLFRPRERSLGVVSVDILYTTVYNNRGFPAKEGKQLSQAGWRVFPRREWCFLD